MKEQMEIRLEGTKNCRTSQQRRNRARWWFNQMRLVVDQAIDWKAGPQPPPEQTYLTFAHGK